MAGAVAVRSYLERMEGVRVVGERVPPTPEVTRHLLRDQDQVVYFKDLNGHEAVGNLWSTRARICHALGVTPEGLIQRLSDAIHHPMDPPMDVGPRSPLASTKDFDLRELPIPQWYPGDAGRYLTSGVVVAEWRGKRNLSYHRMLLLDEHRVVARLVPRHLYRMAHGSLDEGRELPIAVVIGPDPEVLLAAGMSLEYEVDELRIASALRHLTAGKPLPAIRATNGITIPAEVEYVLEGKITGMVHREGPFVDGTGTYDRVRDEPVIEFERLHHVAHPVFHAILSGGREHFMFMGLPREPLIYESVKRVVPDVKGVRLTEGSGAWLHGIVAIRQQREGDGKNAILAALAGHPSMKMCIVVDDDIDIHDDRDVDWAVATRFQADRDLVVIKGARGSSIDPSAEDGITAKMGIDATKPLGRPEFDRPRL